MENILEIQRASKVIVKTPKQYNIVFYNDDFTPFEFVEFLLSEVFKKNYEQSKMIAYKIHKQGKCVVAVYPKEIADTKKYLVDQYSKESNFPLRCEIEIS